MNTRNYAGKVLVLGVLIGCCASIVIQSGSDDDSKGLEDVAGEYLRNIKESSLVHVVLQREVSSDTSGPILKILGSVVPVVLQNAGKNIVTITKINL